METATKERQLILNRVHCKECGKELISHYHHDYKTCGCINKTSVDGGLSYIRYGGMDMTKVESDPVYLDDPYEKVRESFHWGTYGKDGVKPLEFVPLYQLSSPHILKIVSLMTGKIKPWIEELFQKEIRYRKEHKIWVDDIPVNE